MMKKLAFSLLLIAATLIVKNSNAQTRGNASDWRIPPPYIPSEPRAQLPPVVLPVVPAPEPALPPGDLDPIAPKMPVLPEGKLPYFIPPTKSPGVPMPYWIPPVNPPGVPMPYPIPKTNPPEVSPPQTPVKPNRLTVGGPAKPKGGTPGAPTTPGYWSSTKLGGGEAYWWHSGTPGDPHAEGPGYYDHFSGGWLGTFTGTSVGPVYWHVPFDTPPTGIPAGKGHFTPTKPADGNARAYYLHPGIPGDPYARGPGYYDTLGGSDTDEILNLFVGPYYWIPDVPAPPVRRPVQPNQPGQLFDYTPDIIITTSILLF